MLNRDELREIAKLRGDGSYYVSLYLNVNPVTNPGGEYIIWLKNALREAAEKAEKAELKRFEKDLAAIESHALANRRNFKKGLAVLSSEANGLWREYNLSVPLRNELIVEKTPYIKPLLEVLDNYERYAALLVDKESARIFVIHLGEITEYGEMHTPNVPGRHKKGGWSALAQSHYERHIDYHVGLHLRDVVKKLDSFLGGEEINRLFIGGSEEAVHRTMGLLPRQVTEKVAGAFSAGMFEGNQEVLRKIEPVMEAVERESEQMAVDELMVKAGKEEKAVVGLEGVLRAIDENKVMRLVIFENYTHVGFRCSGCKALSVKGEVNCPYCGGRMDQVNYFIDYMAQKAVEQGAPVKVVRESDALRQAGGVGAFLRY
ncbi:MAG: Vms1/Ankzf1 family peptidyl-tRNA hydrolase [Thermodesulfovibrionales bacterium]